MTKGIMKLKRKVNIHKVKGIQAIMDYHQFCFINRDFIITNTCRITYYGESSTCNLSIRSYHVGD